MLPTEAVATERCAARLCEGLLERGVWAISLPAADRFYAAPTRTAQTPDTEFVLRFDGTAWWLCSTAGARLVRFDTNDLEPAIEAVHSIVHTRARRFAR